MEKVIKPLTDEDKLMGKTEPDTYTITELNAFTNKRIYEVTNLELNNAPTVLYGNMIGAFLDETAKIELQKGADVVTSKGYLVKVYEEKPTAKENLTVKPTNEEISEVEEMDCHVADVPRNDVKTRRKRKVTNG